MKQVKQVLRNTITDTTRRIDNIIDDQYNLGRRGEAPKGATWNYSEEDQMNYLDNKKDELYTLIEECNTALELIEDDEGDNETPEQLEEPHEGWECENE